MKKNSFVLKLSEQLKKLEHGNVEVGDMGDGSGSWVEIKVGKKVFCFGFDNDGMNLTDIGLYKDKGGELVYGIFKPKPEPKSKPEPPKANPQTNVNQRVVTAGFVQYLKK